MLRVYALNRPLACNKLYLAFDRGVYLMSVSPAALTPGLLFSCVSWGRGCFSIQLENRLCPAALLVNVPWSSSLSWALRVLLCLWKHLTPAKSCWTACLADFLWPQVPLSDFSAVPGCPQHPLPSKRAPWGEGGAVGMLHAQRLVILKADCLLLCEVPSSEELPWQAASCEHCCCASADY